MNAEMFLIQSQVFHERLNQTVFVLAMRVYNVFMEKTIIDKLNKLFRMPPLRYDKKAKGGFLSDNYILRNSTGKYFLKKYRPSVKNRLSIIARAEQFFWSQDMPVIMPLKTKQGKTYFSIDGGFYSLFPYIPGKTFDHKTEFPTVSMVKSIATNLATMHLLSKMDFPIISPEQLSEWDPKKVLSATAREDFDSYANKILILLKAKKKKSLFDKSAFALLKLKVALVNTIPNKFTGRTLGKPHIVHGDYHAQNLFFDKAGNVTHIFDLEKSDIRPRSLELIRSMFIICFNSYFNARRYKLAQVYLETYNSIYPIKRTELESAIRFMYYKHLCNLWIEKEHYLNNNTRPDPLLAVELRFLKYLSKNLEILIKKLR